MRKFLRYLNHLMADFLSPTSAERNRLHGRSHGEADLPIVLGSTFGRLSPAKTHPIHSGLFAPSRHRRNEVYCRWAFHGVVTLSRGVTKAAIVYSTYTFASSSHGCWYGHLGIVFGRMLDRLTTVFRF